MTPPAATPGALSRDDVLAICRRQEAYGGSPVLTLHGSDAIVAAIRDVLLAMARRSITPLALADALDRTLPKTPPPVTREDRLASTYTHPGARSAPAAPRPQHQGEPIQGVTGDPP